VTDYVARMYESGPDPWRIGEGFYEQRKRQILLGCLQRRDFLSHLFLPGCELFYRCGKLVNAVPHDREIER